MATKTASVSRSTLTNGLGAAPQMTVSNQNCTPLDTVSSETVTRLKLDSAYELRQTSFESAALDIRKGDTLTVDGVDYMVHAVEPYDWRDTKHLRLVVEKVASP